MRQLSRAAVTGRIKTGQVGRLLTIALGSTAVAVAVVELVFFATRWPVIVFGLISPAVVVMHLARRGARKSDSESARSE